MDINITPDVKYLDGSKWHCSDFIKKPITSSWFKERISFVVFAIGLRILVFMETFFYENCHFLDTKLQKELHILA